MPLLRQEVVASGTGRSGWFQGHCRSGLRKTCWLIGWSSRGARVRDDLVSAWAAVWMVLLTKTENLEKDVAVRIDAELTLGMLTCEGLREDQDPNGHWVIRTCNLGENQARESGLGPARCRC